MRQEWTNVKKNTEGKANRLTRKDQACLTRALKPANKRMIFCHIFVGKIKKLGIEH